MTLTEAKRIIGARTVKKITGNDYPQLMILGLIRSKGQGDKTGYGEALITLSKYLEKRRGNPVLDGIFTGAGAALGAALITKATAKRNPMPRGFDPFIRRLYDNLDKAKERGDANAVKRINMQIDRALKIFDQEYDKMAYKSKAGLRRLPNPKGQSLTARGFKLVDGFMNGWKIVRDKDYRFYILKPDGSIHGKYDTSGGAAANMAALIKAGRLKNPRQIDKRRVRARGTGERGTMVKALPKGFVKIAWDDRSGAPTLTKRDQLKLARNPARAKFDAFARKHLTAWLNNTVAASDRKAARADIMRALKDYPEMLERNSWPEMRDAGRRMRNPGRGMVTVHYTKLFTGGTLKGITRREQSTMSEGSAKGFIEAGRKGIKKPIGGSPYKFTDWQILPAAIRNPTVRDVSEMFQGKASGAVKSLKAADTAPGDLARVGRLAFLKVNGKTLRIPGAVVCADTKERLWIAGTNSPMLTQRAKPGEGLDFGEISEIGYITSKQHVGGGKTFEYVHEFGEDGGRRPHLIVDSDGMPIVRGGSYKIRAEGIIN